MFTYPVLTYSLLYIDGKFVDEDFARWCSNHNIKWSDSNFFVSDNVGVLSNCCRLLSDTKKIDAFINSIGGTALSVGSCRVSTINLVRIAYESNFNKKNYLKILQNRTLLNCKALTSMRHILKRNIEKGLLPNYQDGAVELDKQFCTIGGIGMYEVMDLFGLIETDEFGCKSYSDEAIEFTTDILDTINSVKDSFECDFTFNVEMIPAENCAGVICQADNILFEQNKYFIYSNQWIPLMEKCTIQEKCRLGSLFDKKCGGGCIAHINIENRFPNEETAWDMLNYVAAQGVIYFAFTTKINVCKNNHSFVGESHCPICGGEIKDTFARVVGFYTPTSNYQKIRKTEFDKRKWMNVLINDGVMR
jgi:ribonucleoside-triphosphate reductase